MKTIIHVIIICILFAGSTACSDFLDKEPHSLTLETYFNNEAELQTFLTGVYAPIRTDHFYGLSYPVHNAGGDDLSFYQRANSAASIICANAGSNNSYITAFWKALYDGINRANLLIENVDRNTSIPQDDRDQARAEAIFLRSFYYFNLVQGWGDVPFRLKAAESVNGLSIPRTGKQVIYDKIIQDIIDVIPSLPASNTLNYTGRVTQSVARGMLARIYLFRAGEHFRDHKTAGEAEQSYFAEARRWALEVKNSYLHGLVSPYRRVFIDLMEDKYNSAGILESIWEVEHAGNNTTEAAAAGRIGHTIGFGAIVDLSSNETFRNLTGMHNPGYSYKFIYASVKLFEMYESEADTARGDWNITPYEYIYASQAPGQVTGRRYYYGKRPPGLVLDGFTIEELSQASSNNNQTRCCAKYNREYELITPKHRGLNATNFPVLRYSDVLLMLAEADNELTDSPSGLAYECLNAVRERACLLPLSGLDKNGFREAIKKERAMELCFEAIRRWDLIRWGDYYAAMTGMQSYVSKPGWNNAYRYAADYYKISEYYNYFPIPVAEISVNSAITVNNQGW
jgi:hypothetical protein